MFKKIWKSGKYVLIALAVFFGIFLLFKPRVFSDPLSTAIFANKGELIAAMIAEDGQWRFPESDSLPDKFKQCIIHFEDEYFYSHPGVNPVSIGRALIQNIKSGSIVSGGSTITMQTVRLIRKGQGRTIKEKFIEMLHAFKLEVYLTKEEILLLHASHAPFGGNVVGIEAAAWRYYGRDPFSLSWAECATLAVLPNAPSLIYPGKNAKMLIAKRDRLLDKLALKGVISSKEAELSKYEELPSKPYPIPQIAPHLLTTIINTGRKGTRVNSSIETRIQVRAQEIVDRFQNQNASNQVYNCAALVAEVESGNVLAYIGNSTNLKSKQNGGAVDVIRAPRSTGSILKPFLYASALQEGLFLPNSLIDDVPIFYAGYSPQNYSHNYEGLVPASKALARSLNVPAVIMLKEYGVMRFYDRLKSLGMSTLHRPSSDYGLSLILGGAEGSLWDIAAMYASMGRVLTHYTKGSAQYFKHDVRSLSITQKERKIEVSEEPPTLEAGAIWQTIKAMEEVNRPKSEDGWQQFSSSRRVAWKTGTSYGYRDAWAVGIDGKYVVAVWVGNADGTPRHGIVGVKMAAPVLFEIFKQLPTNNWYTEPYEDLKNVAVCRQSGYRLSPFCIKSDTISAPISCLSAKACEWHKTVTLDKAGEYQVHSDCENLQNTQLVNWFVVPPVQEWYFKKSNVWYKDLPPMRSDCLDNNNRSEMQFIYPRQMTIIKIPRELNGDLGAVVFKLAHQRANAKVYWYLNEQMLDITETKHQIEVAQQPGFFKLTVVDDKGNSITQKIQFE